MKRGISIIFICLLILLICPATAKADLVYEPGEENFDTDMEGSSDAGREESQEPEQKSSYLPLVAGGFVLAVVILAGILIWFFFDRKKK